MARHRGKGKGRKAPELNLPPSADGEEMLQTRKERELAGAIKQASEPTSRQRKKGKGNSEKDKFKGELKVQEH